MAGKPTLSAAVRRKIKTLARRGDGKRKIAEKVGVSPDTVRRVLDPDYAKRERARHAARAAEQYAGRKDNPEYQAYQAAANNSDAHRKRVRISMAKLRANRKAASI